ncbi:MAG: hypothetical protein QHH09_00310 [Microgenomates group bacterium]|nr:hypothetical protein [Microgenomates group bacterium]
MKNKIFYLVLFLFILVIFASFFWFYEARYFVGRASVSSASFSIDNSYLFITPLKAKAGSGEKIRLTVFVLNNQGVGVANKRISLIQDPNLFVEVIQNPTDNFGKAVFDISSNKAAEYYIEVKVEGKSLLQKAHLSFY